MAEKKDDFYDGIPFENKVIDVNFTSEELNMLIKHLGFCGGVLDMAAKQVAADEDSVKVYSNNSDIAFAFRKKLLEYAKLGLPADSAKH